MDQTNDRQQEITAEPSQEELNEVMRVRRDKLQALREQGADPFRETVYERSHSAREILDGFEALEGKTVRIAGRMLSKRIMGKASFSHILDGSGSIQAYLRRDDLGEERYNTFKTLDIGDIVGIEGEVFRTQKGEISVKADGLILLSKSLRPLPEKWHGLKDPDLRYRQRYVDLIVNPEVREIFKTRSKLLRIIREYLEERGFLEVETPVLHTLASSSAAKPFITHHNSLDIPMYLRIEMELSLKRLVVGGLERVYEIGRMFRNEGMDIKHNPEFTMIELYQAYTDYRGMMRIVEDLFSDAALQVKGSMKFSYQGVELDLTPPWAVMTMMQAVAQHTGADMTGMTDEQARQAARGLGVHVEPGFTRGQALYAVFDELVEPKLIQPTFILEYPIEVSPLAKRCAHDPLVTERFEFFINGCEYGNAFSELNDPIDQKERFVLQARTKMAGEGDAQVDEDYVQALEVGLPPTGGLGIGFDRMVMLMTDAYSIRDVILFPTMKLRG